jgi:hypothetical protein
LDHDGHLDIVSGSYWPGDLSLFRGLGGGKFAPAHILQSKDGGNLNAGPPWQNEQEPEMDSLAASPALVDWENDGDLDLLVGNIAGRVILIVNEGTAQAAAFGVKRPVQDATSDIKVDSDAGPEVADWDGDGLWDLLVGAGDGSVRFYRNVGTSSQPTFAAGVKLIEGIDWEESVLATGAAPQRSGMRSKCSVTDWNRDGRLDLLVGDFMSQSKPEPVLSAEQITERDRLRAERDVLSQTPPDYQDEEATAAWSERYQKASEALSPLEAGSTMHGFVWVYLRTPAAGELHAQGERAR